MVLKNERNEVFWGVLSEINKWKRIVRVFSDESDRIIRRKK